MILAVLIVISLAMVLHEQETRVSASASGSSVGGNLSRPGVHLVLTFSWFVGGGRED